MRCPQRAYLDLVELIAVIQPSHLLLPRSSLLVGLVPELLVDVPAHPSRTKHCPTPPHMMILLTAPPTHQAECGCSLRPTNPKQMGDAFTIRVTQIDYLKSSFSSLWVVHAKCHAPDIPECCSFSADMQSSHEAFIWPQQGYGVSTLPDYLWQWNTMLQSKHTRQSMLAKNMLWCYRQTGERETQNCYGGFTSNGQMQHKTCSGDSTKIAMVITPVTCCGDKHHAAMLTALLLWCCHQHPSTIRG